MIDGDNQRLIIGTYVHTAYLQFIINISGVLAYSQLPYIKLFLNFKTLSSLL